VLASVGSTPYKIVLLLHILSVLVAFAPAFVWPITNVALRSRNEKLGQGVAAQIVRNSMTVHGPALVLTGVFGILLIVLSDEAWEFSQVWISAAFLLWFALLGVVFGGLVPAERKVALGDDAAEKKVSMFGGISHLLLLLMLIVMIWKPGL
jgi:uncharacterized membrane protein